MQKILLVDDEKTITDINERYLAKEGFDVYIARNGVEALTLYRSMPNFDLVITDIMMPDIDGYELMDEILELDPNQSFLFITAKASDQDKLYALGIGADDYIVKPFNPRELVLRVKNILKRVQSAEISTQDILIMGDLAIVADQHLATIAGHELTLTLKGFDILLLLVQSKNKILSKVELYSKVWNDTFMDDDNTLNVHIHDIRKEMKRWATEKTPVIETVWGMGYKMEEKPNEI